MQLALLAKFALVAREGEQCSTKFYNAAIRCKQWHTSVGITTIRTPAPRL